MKHFGDVAFAHEIESPLSRGRGLKLSPDGKSRTMGRSPLSRGRGLKLVDDGQKPPAKKRRPSRGGVD